MSTVTRRDFISRAAALSPWILCPEAAQAFIAARLAPWSLAVADRDEDLPTVVMSRLHGAVPAGLRGTLYRNGPAKFRRAGGSATHWFDGDGLVRAFALTDRDPTLTARFVDTPKRRVDTAAQAVVSGGFGTVPAPGITITSSDSVNAANTSMVMRGQELWALWEAGSPVSVHPTTLATRGFKTFRPDLEHAPFLAHPRIEPGGRLWNLGQVGTQAIVWRIAASGALESATPVTLPRASYIHDFTATARHLIIVLQPWIQSGPALPVVSSMQWQPTAGTQILVLDKADLSRRQVYELPAFFFFHLGDAWERPDGTLAFDVCRYADPAFAAQGASDLLEGNDHRIPQATLALILLDPTGRASIEDTRMVAEFPRSDSRLAGQARAFTIHVWGRSADGPLFHGIAVHDWQHDRRRVFDFGIDHLVEEMIFVPHPEASVGDQRGWVVGPSINLRTRATELHVFDAARIDAGPITSWRAPVALPMGFHGVFA